MNPNHPVGPPGTDKAAKRTPHSIRFFGPEWDRIEAFAGDRGLTAPEFVRFATLAAIEEGDGGRARRLDPLIETTFRATYILVLKLRYEMHEAGKGEALESLIAEAHEKQDVLLGGGSD